MLERKNAFILILGTVCVASLLFNLYMIVSGALGEGQSKLASPDYDSGFVSIGAGAGIWLAHNLNTKDVLVYLVGTSPTDPTINQWKYGGFSDGTKVEGIMWGYLNETHIRVWRFAQDGSYPQVRVRMWIIK